MPDDPAPTLDLAPSLERMTAGLDNLVASLYQQRLDTCVLVGMAVSRKVWHETRDRAWHERTTALYAAITALPNFTPVIMAGADGDVAGFDLVESRLPGALVGWRVNDENGCHPLLAPPARDAPC